nr:hypothetical protein [Tanacetum cinerariifolium]
MMMILLGQTEECDMMLYTVKTDMVMLVTEVEDECRSCINLTSLAWYSCWPRSVPVDQLRSVPAEQLRSVPADQFRSVPAEQLRLIPADQLRSVPADQLRSVPADQLRSVPANQLRSVPKGFY